jgi:hypothetical protein
VTSRSCYSNDMDLYFTSNLNNAMSNNKRIKHWQPARFTLASERLSAPAFSADHAVVILNQPLTNKELLVQLCGEGSS